MIGASQALIDYLNSGEKFIMADLYTFSLANGTVLRYTTADIDLTVDGDTYLADGLIIQRDKIRWVTGLEVDELSLTITGGSTILANEMTFSQLLTTGGFDKAEVILERIFMPTWGDMSLGTIRLFAGRVADAHYGRTEAQLTIKSYLELLNIMMPRNLVSPSCTNTLYDARCGVTKVKTSGQWRYGTGVDLYVGLAAGVEANIFDLGFMVCESGANAGIRRTVKTAGGDLTNAAIMNTLSSSGFSSVAATSSQWSGITGADAIVVTPPFSAASHQVVYVYASLTGGGTVPVTLEYQADGSQTWVGHSSYTLTADGTLRAFSYNTTAAWAGKNVTAMRLRITGNAGRTLVLKTWHTHPIPVATSYHIYRVVPIVPFPKPFTAADNVALYRGCDRTQATCTTKFNNLGNFRGCPYVPVPEVVL